MAKKTRNQKNNEKNLVGLEALAGKGGTLPAKASSPALAGKILPLLAKVSMPLS